MAILIEESLLLILTMMLETKISLPLSLGQQLKSQRQTLTHQAVGLPHTISTKKTGLSLTEVAVLSGVSSAWLSKLERDTLKLSDFEGLKRLLVVLQFSNEKQHQLLRQAGWQPETLNELPEKQRCLQLQKTLDAIKCPAYILDYLWHPISFNHEASLLFTHWLGNQSQYKNFLDYLLLDPQSRVFIQNWAKEAPKLLKQFHQQLSPFKDLNSVIEFTQKKSKQSRLFAKHQQQTAYSEFALPILNLNFLNKNLKYDHYQQMIFSIPNTPNWQLIIWLHK